MREEIRLSDLSVKVFIAIVEILGKVAPEVLSGVGKNCFPDDPIARGFKVGGLDWDWMNLGKKEKKVLKEAGFTKETYEAFQKWYVGEDIPDDVPNSIYKRILKLRHQFLKNYLAFKE